MSVDKAWFQLRWGDILRAKRVRPSHEATDQGLYYYKRLADLNQNILDKAIDDAIENLAFFPTLKDLRKAYDARIIELNLKKRNDFRPMTAEEKKDCLSLIEAEDIVRTRATGAFRKVLLDIIYQAKQEAPF